MKYLLDTVILIDHLNGIKAATMWLDSLKPKDAAISVITRAEVLTGIKEGEELFVRSLLDYFSCLPITVSLSDLAASLRKKHHWKLPDAFQAALAIENGLLLATRNTKDFNLREHPFVYVPYKIS